METNLQKAKRLLKDNAEIQGICLKEDSYLFELLELAATPDKNGDKPHVKCSCFSDEEMQLISITLRDIYVQLPKTLTVSKKINKLITKVYELRGKIK